MGDEQWAAELNKKVEIYRRGRGKPSRRDFEIFAVVETVSTWEDLQRCLNTHFADGTWIFRGHARAEWRLEPTLDRAMGYGPDLERDLPSPLSFRQKVIERVILLEFQRRAHHYLSRLPADNQSIDWLAIMQHYGAPTRLLDWTFSPYVALYFAVEEAVPGTDCAIWAIDSDWLKASANNHFKNDPSYSEAGLDEYVNNILFHEGNLPRIVLVNPRTMNDRVAAQQGVFLSNLDYISNFDLTLLQMGWPSQELSSWHKPLVRKILIKGTERLRLLTELKRMNISRASLFPGLDGFARSLRVELDTIIPSLDKAAGMSAEHYAKAFGGRFEK